MINLDAMAGLPMEAQVRDAFLQLSSETWSHVQAQHPLGQKSAAKLKEAGDRILQALHSREHLIQFTSGATEANALACLGAASHFQAGDHFLTSPIEHSSLLGLIPQLNRRGIEVDQIEIDSQGRFSFSAFLEKLHPRTRLVSLQWVNQEMGTIQDLQGIANYCREQGIYFHSDASQALGKISVDLSQLPVDLLSLSASKFGGLSGLGALIYRPSCPLGPLMAEYEDRRGQTFLRPGNFFIPSLVASALALERATQSLEENWQKITILRESFLDALTLPFQFNNTEDSVPHCLNLFFPKRDLESLLQDCPQISIGRGSACSEGKKSHVLTAVGLSPERIASSLRVSFGPHLDLDRVRRAAELISLTVKVDMVRKPHAQNHLSSH